MILSSLSIPNASATVQSSPESNKSQAIESRLARLASTIQERANQLPESSQPDSQVAIGWLDGGRRRGFVNSRRGGWGDGYRGGFVNYNPWRNGWRDGGGFLNYRR